MTSSVFHSSPPVAGDRDGARLIRRFINEHRILVGVLIAHFILIVGPFLWYWVEQWFKPEKPKVFNVRLVSPPPPPPSSAQPISKTVEKPPVSPPTPPTPPKPKEIKKTVEKPKIKPPKPKKVVKKTPAPPPKPPEKTWKAASVDDIKIAQNVVSKHAPKPIAVSKISSSSLFSNISKNFKFKSTSTATGVASYTEKRYFDEVAAYLHQRWRQPGRAQLGGKTPSVEVRVTVDADGRIVSSNVTGRSGIGAMDHSVELLLQSIKNLPTPPKGLSIIDIVLEVD